MRARNIKPGFYKNESLLECDPLARILFSGLWCLADREGRLEDRPKRIKIEILPCDNCDVDALLQSLHDHGLIVRYEIGGDRYIEIPTFLEHQKPHSREKASTIPPYKEQKARPRHDLGDAKPALNPESPILNAECSGAPPGKKVWEAGVGLFPKLTTANPSMIKIWLDGGADPDLDIIPEIKKHAGKDIGAWKYFTGGIMDAKATRLKPLPPGTARMQNQKAPEVRANKGVV